MTLSIEIDPTDLPLAVAMTLMHHGHIDADHVTPCTTAAVEAMIQAVPSPLTAYWVTNVMEAIDHLERDPLTIAALRLDVAVQILKATAMRDIEDVSQVSAAYTDAIDFDLLPLDQANDVQATTAIISMLSQQPMQPKPEPARQSARSPAKSAA